MYLNELYERLGQLLKEHGDMQVSRLLDLRIDGYPGIKDRYIDYTSDTFLVYKERSGDGIITKKHLIITNPLG